MGLRGPPVGRQQLFLSHQNSELEQELGPVLGGSGTGLGAHQYESDFQEQLEGQVGVSGTSGVLGTQHL